MKKNKKVEIEIVIDGETKRFNFIFNDTNNIYIDEENKIKIQAIINSNEYCYNVLIIQNNNEYKNLNNIIMQEFIKKYNELQEKQREALEDGVEYTREDESSDENHSKVPYDPSSIRVAQGRFSLKEIVEMINGTEYDDPILDLSPDFQRNFVWDITRKSRLIESILLRIPLPVFYLARDSEGMYQVVDGAQRLGVINDYFNNKFRLKNLEYLKEEYENKYFCKSKLNSLAPKAVRLIRAYQIDCNIIEPDTPHRVKLDIFKRLNTGGRNLNKQEIRNAILRKNSREFIKKLAESELFIKATDNGVKSIRMMDQELVIRYIGFYLIYKQPNLFPELRYNGKMDDFLDYIVEILNEKYKILPFEKIEQDFYKSMKNAVIMFEDYAFRKVEVDFREKNKNMINKSLFTCFAVLLSNYSDEKVRKRGQILNEFVKELYSDSYLYDSITYATNDVSRIDTAFLKIDNFLKGIYG